MIKELDKNDLELITELENSFGYVLNNIKEDLLNNPFSHYLLYFMDGKIVGYLNFYLLYERIEIANFNVLDNYQNKHIGTSIIKYLIDKYNNILNITLEVKKDNTKAIHIYEKMGFIQVAIREKYYQGIDGILMEWRKR